MSQGCQTVPKTPFKMHAETPGKGWNKTSGQYIAGCPSPVAIPLHIRSAALIYTFRSVQGDATKTPRDDATWHQDF